jgi:cytidylate kinase
MTLVTLSAPYGAGGSQVGPLVAEELGVPFVDRAVPTRVAERLAMPVERALRSDQSVGGWLARSSIWLGHIGSALSAVPPPGETGDEDRFRRETEEVLREYAAGPGAVVLGRAGAIVLRDVPGALHVRLEGAPEARVLQAMRLEGVDRATAERRRDEVDDAREAYVRHFYRADPADTRLYHLVIDSTVLPLPACAQLIAGAARARTATRG